VRKPKASPRDLSDKFSIEGYHPNVYKEIIPYLWPRGQLGLKGRVIFSLVALLVSKLITVMIPFVYKDAVDSLGHLAQASAEEVKSTLLYTCFMLVGVYGAVRMGSTGLQQVRDAVFARVSAVALRALSLKTFNHVHNLSLRFHLSRKTGGLSRVIDRGTKGIEFLLRMMLFNLVPTGLEIALVLGIMVWQFSPVYMVVTFAIVAIYVIATYYITEWRTNLRRSMNNADSDASQKAIDSLLNYETVKYFGNEKRESVRYDRSMASYEEASVRINTSLAVLNFVQAVIISVGLMVIMGLSVNDIAKGKQTVGDFVMLNALLIQLYMPLNFLGTVMREIKQAKTDMEEMFHLLYQPVEVKDIPNAPPLAFSKGDIVFENVFFSYDPDRPILKGISFHIPAGKTLAVVGASGAGKSTLSRLLFRFYDVGSGRILIDGQDIRSVSQENLRSYMGIVPQDTVLFNDTLGYNIRYGQFDASEEEVIRAIDQAQLTDLLKKFPQGLDTMVGERGLKLSGGEKQRVAIARTLLKNPPLLILDEATSALDTATEQDIQRSLVDIAQNRTTLVIAHRLSTVVNADEIIVMNDGQIIEQGTHSALIALGGVYAHMWQQQLEDSDQKSETVEDLS
jgi:ATP-binding cassette, subfamily B, heavy metal transporter